MKGMQSNRPDHSHALIHLTGNRGDTSAFDALISILREKRIRASGHLGFIKGKQAATCFTEMPLSAIPTLVKYSRLTKHPYEGYGIAIHKSNAFSQGARPVIYLPENEAYWLPEKQRWRHVRFEYGNIDFTHEREWRTLGDFTLNDTFGYYVIVNTPECEDRIISSLGDRPDSITGFLHIDILKDFI